MPIEIKELQISINVYDEDTATGTDYDDLDAIVEQCVEQIASITKDKNER